MRNLCAFAIMIDESGKQKIGNEMQGSGKKTIKKFWCHALSLCFLNGHFEIRYDEVNLWPIILVYNTRKLENNRCSLVN